MATRAVPVVVERSPGGGSGWNLRVGGTNRFLFGTDHEAYGWIWAQLARQGARSEELDRVCGLLACEGERKLRAEVTAEVSHG